MEITEAVAIVTSVAGLDEALKAEREAWTDE